MKAVDVLFAFIFADPLGLYNSQTHLKSHGIIKTKKKKMWRKNPRKNLIIIHRIIYSLILS